MFMYSFIEARLLLLKSWHQITKPPNRIMIKLIKINRFAWFI